MQQPSSTLCNFLILWHAGWDHYKVPFTKFQQLISVNKYKCLHKQGEHLLPDDASIEEREDKVESNRTPGDKMVYPCPEMSLQSKLACTRTYKKRKVSLVQYTEKSTCRAPITCNNLPLWLRLIYRYCSTGSNVSN